MCLLWERDASGGLTCRSQACGLNGFFSLLLADIKACLPKACESFTHPQEFLLVLGAQKSVGIGSKGPHVWLLSDPGGKGTV